MSGDILLETRNLKTYFHTEDGLIKAVDDVSFVVESEKTLGVVGESGCGKSVTALSIMQLIRPPRGVIEGGDILYYADGNIVEITKYNHYSPQMRKFRGNEIAMIFQEPMTSFNPVYTIGRQIVEAVQIHQKLDNTQARERAIEMLRRVGISDPGILVDEYPHQLSGGMRQRAMIAMALSCDPKLLIADEPTTALDVTIEAQILELIQNLQNDIGMSIMIITHDMGVIAETADRVIVMYTGKVVEKSSTDAIFHDTKHPYTQGLLRSIPQIGRKEKLVPIVGSVPNLLTLPEGWCYFAPRCPRAMDICRRREPPFVQVGTDHHAKCWLYGEAGGKEAGS